MTDTKNLPEQNLEYALLQPASVWADGSSNSDPTLRLVVVRGTPSHEVVQATYDSARDLGVLVLQDHDDQNPAQLFYTEITRGTRSPLGVVSVINAALTDGKITPLVKVCLKDYRNMQVKADYVGVYAQRGA